MMEIIKINKRQPVIMKKNRLSVVRTKGLEPPRRETPDPKSGAATNYATRATLLSVSGCKDKEYFLSTKDF